MGIKGKIIEQLNKSADNNINKVFKTFDEFEDHLIQLQKNQKEFEAYLIEIRDDIKELKERCSK